MALRLGLTLLVCEHRSRNPSSSPYVLFRDAMDTNVALDDSTVCAYAPPTLPQSTLSDYNVALSEQTKRSRTWPDARKVFSLRR